MAMHHRLFIAFAVEDVRSRDFLVGQGRNERTPFEFTDMSVKEPWSDEWKRRCRTRIKGCDGMIALVSRSTANALGQLWEVSCAREEGVPVMGIYTTQDQRPVTLPPIFANIPVRDWTWNNIQSFLNRL
jgi:hypothetical protein